MVITTSSSLIKIFDAHFIIEISDLRSSFITKFIFYLQQVLF